MSEKIYILREKLKYIEEVKNSFGDFSHYIVYLIGEKDGISTQYYELID